MPELNSNQLRMENPMDNLFNDELLEVLTPFIEVKREISVMDFLLRYALLKKTANLIKYECKY